MALPECTRQRLARGVEERTAAAAESLLVQQDPATAKAHLEWVDTAGRLLATGERPSGLPPIYRAGLIGLACSTLLLLAWSLDVGNNAVRLELRVGGLSLDLPDGWDLGEGGGLAASRVNVPDGLAKLYVPTLGDQEETPRGFALAGEGLRLETLTFPKRAALDLEASGAGLRFFLNQGKAEGQLSVRSGRLDRFAPDRQTGGPMMLESSPPLSESVAFASGELAGQGAPFALHLDTTETWGFIGLRVSGLEFRRERFPGSNQWRSTLLEGKGELLDVGRSFSLRDGEWLHLQGLDGVLDLKRDTEGINLLFQGKVDGLKAGPEGLERDLTPSLLEYLSQAKETAVLWGGLLFLWGLAWKLRAFW